MLRVLLESFLNFEKFFNEKIDVAFLEVVIYFMRKNWTSLKSIDTGKFYQPEKKRKQRENEEKIEKGVKKMKTGEWNHYDFLENLSSFDGENKEDYVPAPYR